MVSTACSRSESDPDWLLMGMIVPRDRFDVESGEPNIAEESRGLVWRCSFRRCHR